MLNEVLKLTKGDLANVTKPLHVKKKVQLPFCQLVKQKLKEFNAINTTKKV